MLLSITKKFLTQVGFRSVEQHVTLSKINAWKKGRINMKLSRNVLEDDMEMKTWIIILMESLLFLIFFVSNVGPTNQV